ncbi:MAG: cob(I)yrinic acid a,c-diamide adenosyltransferase [Firmicutes bacterium]|nr:cob(I)yrinic acid a,c-diamide adenosyltransferase [Bacillota bacterium]
MSINKTGYVQVYTGNGKGKTTAALGITMRASGADMKIAFIQFMKALGYSEQKILPTLPGVTWKTLGKPFFIAKAGSISEEELAEYGDTCVVFEEGNPPAEYVKMINDGFAEAREMVLSGKYDMVVLDEINCTMFFGLLGVEEVLELIRNKPAHTELILTGRCAPEEIIEAADLVTEMREIKHYYNDGVQARRGIED